MSYAQRAQAAFEEAGAAPIPTGGYGELLYCLAKVMMFALLAIAVAIDGLPHEN